MFQVSFVESDKCVYPSCFMLGVLDQACQTGGPENVSKQCVPVFPVALNTILASFFVWQLVSTASIGDHQDSCTRAWM